MTHEITYEEFKARVDKAIGQYVPGLGHEDFVDAEWYDLYDSTGGEPREDQIIDLLSEADMIFAEMVEAVGGARGGPKILKKFVDRGIKAQAAADAALDK